MLSTALNRSLVVAARSSGKKTIRSLSTIEIESSNATDSKGHVDPMQIFDKIDTNSDGVLSKEEFRIAIEKMHYVSSSTVILMA